MNLTLVDPEVTRSKLRAELRRWAEDPEQQKRGWIVLAQDETVPSIQLALLGRISTSFPFGFLPIVVCSVLLTFENYDLWPPSLTFIDIFTRQPARPLTRAFLPTGDGPRDVLIEGHPERSEPFLCLPGIREYHRHPQHTGDDWLLHRPFREGSIAVICDRLWQLMARNIVGLNVGIQALPVLPLQAKLVIQIAQGDVETISAAKIVAAPAPQVGSADQKS